MSSRSEFPGNEADESFLECLNYSQVQLVEQTHDRRQPTNALDKCGCLPQKELPINRENPRGFTETPACILLPVCGKAKHCNVDAFILHGHSLSNIRDNYAVVHGDMVEATHVAFGSECATKWRQAAAQVRDDERRASASDPRRRIHSMHRSTGLNGHALDTRSISAWYQRHSVSSSASATWVTRDIRRAIFRVKSDERVVRS